MGLDPIEVNVERMLGIFQTACQELGDVWSHALSADTRAAVIKLADRSGGAPFHMEDGLWVRVVYDFAAAYHRGSVDRSHLLRSLTPLYLARVASFVVETRALSSQEVEEKIEQLCRSYEDLKPYLIANWTGSGGTQTLDERLMPVPRETREEETRYA